jgi:hypothetical protein
MAIDAALRRFVRDRAGNRCEYCHCHQDDLPFATFHIEHAIAKQHGGTDDESNLCLSCHWCNFFKGPNIATLAEGELVPLFNPRVHAWDEHFALVGDVIESRTPIGVGTLRLLEMNDADRRELRRLAGPGPS